MPEKQKQKQKQSVRQTVNVIFGATPRRRRTVGALRRKAYQRITMQNLRDQSRSEGVAKAVAAVGGIKNLKMPYETLDRAVHREQHSILFNAAEPERVKSSGIPKYAKPEEQPRQRRAYLSSGAKPKAAKKTRVRGAELEARRLQSDLGAYWQTDVRTPPPAPVREFGTDTIRALKTTPVPSSSEEAMDDRARLRQIREAIKHLQR